MAPTLAARLTPCASGQRAPPATSRRAAKSRRQQQRSPGDDASNSSTSSSAPLPPPEADWAAPAASSTSSVPTPSASASASASAAPLTLLPVPARDSAASAAAFDGRATALDGRRGSIAASNRAAFHHSFASAASTFSGGPIELSLLVGAPIDAAAAAARRAPVAAVAPAAPAPAPAAGGTAPLRTLEAAPPAIADRSLITTEDYSSPVFADQLSILLNEQPLLREQEEAEAEAAVSPPAAAEPAAAAERAAADSEAPLASGSVHLARLVREAAAETAGAEAATAGAAAAEAAALGLTAAKSAASVARDVTFEVAALAATATAVAAARMMAAAAAAAAAESARAAAAKAEAEAAPRHLPPPPPPPPLRKPAAVPRMPASLATAAAPSPPPPVSAAPAAEAALVAGPSSSSPSTAAPSTSAAATVHTGSDHVSDHMRERKLLADLADVEERFAQLAASLRAPLLSPVPGAAERDGARTPAAPAVATATVPGPISGDPQVPPAATLSPISLVLARSGPPQLPATAADAARAAAGAGQLVWRLMATLAARTVGHFRLPANRPDGDSPAGRRAIAKSALLAALATADGPRGCDLAPGPRARLEALVCELESLSAIAAPAESPASDGRWAVNYTTDPELLGQGRPALLRNAGPLTFTFDAAGGRFVKEEAFPLPRRERARLIITGPSTCEIEFEAQRVCGLLTLPVVSAAAARGRACCALRLTYLDGDLRVLRGRGTLYVCTLEDPRVKLDAAGRDVVDLAAARRGLGPADPASAAAGGRGAGAGGQASDTQRLRQGEP